MSNSVALEIPGIWNGKAFQVTIKYNREWEKMVPYVAMVNDIKKDLGLFNNPHHQRLILLTRTKEKGLIPIYRGNYEILEKTQNILVDVDGSIIGSMVKYFEKPYLINPSTEANIFPLESLISSLKEKLSAIVKYVKENSSASSPPDPIGALTKKEAEIYLESYFSYHGLSREEREKIYHGDYFGRKKNSETPNDDFAQIIFNKDPYLEPALFNAVRDGGNSIEYFEKERKRFKIASILLSPDEIRRCFVKRHSKWEPEKIWKEGMNKIINYTYFGIPEGEEERRNYFATKDIGFLDHECISDIYHAAVSILKQTNEIDRLVIFGNSPFFVGRALKFIIPSGRVLIEFPFSGTPNGKRDIFTPLDIVTPQRLEHLRKRLSVAGLSSENKNMLKGKTYFIDVVGSGSGFAYVAEEIFRDFDNAGLETPDLLLMTMNKINIHKSDDRNSMIAKENPDAEGHTVLYFPNVDNTRFTTLAKEAYVKSHMRLDMMSDNGMRGYPEYNAAYWNEEYDYLLKPHYSKTMQILLDYFDQNIESLHLLSKLVKIDTKSCLFCNKNNNLFIERAKPHGIYCSKDCQSEHYQEISNLAKLF